jgi:hypothetical protein
LRPHCSKVLNKSIPSTNQLSIQIGQIAVATFLIPHINQSCNGSIVFKNKIAMGFFLLIPLDCLSKVYSHNVHCTPPNVMNHQQKAVIAIEMHFLKTISYQKSMARYIFFLNFLIARLPSFSVWAKHIAYALLFSTP